jgi:hypothetical protein
MCGLAVIESELQERAERRFLVALGRHCADFRQDSGMPRGAAMVTVAGSGRPR